MKNVTMSLLSLGTLLIATAGFAAESSSATAQYDKRQMIQDCIKRIEAAHPGQTHTQMQATCKSQITTGVVNDGVLTKSMKQAQP